MATKTEPRVPLSRDRVLRAAVAVADGHGIEALTMRRLAEELGVEAMSLYYHVANKEAVLDGIVDVVVSEIAEAVAATAPPAAGAAWKDAMRHRALTARQVLLRHPWAPPVIETRVTMSPALVRYFDSLVGIFREGGFSMDTTHHAMHALGSRALGFTQELFDTGDEEQDEESMQMFMEMAPEVPNIVAMMEHVDHDADTTMLGCDDQFEFEFGLDLLLNGLEALRRQS